MARSTAASTEHDYIVSLVASLNSAKHTVYTNPNGEKNRKIVKDGAEYYPDVMLAPRGQSTSTMIVEVETAETVTEDHALDQWEPYSRLNRVFYLLVPVGALEEAKRICRKFAISARFGKYWHSGGGWRIAFNV